MADQGGLMCRAAIDTPMRLSMPPMRSGPARMPKRGFTQKSAGLCAISGATPVASMRCEFVEAEADEKQNQAPTEDAASYVLDAPCQDFVDHRTL